MTIRFMPGRRAALAVLPLIAILGACTGRSGVTEVDPTPTGGVGPIVLDGTIDEWGDYAAAADARSVFLRFTVEGELFTLQAAPRTVAILVDTDANSATGRPGADEATAGMGIDLEIRFSPPGDAPGDPPRSGVDVRLLAPSGQATPVRSAEAGVVFAPTYASPWYECRFSRAIAGAPGLIGEGRLRAVVVTLDREGRIEAWADPVEVRLPPAMSEPIAGVALPAKPEGCVRVMTFNVLKSAPVSRPDAFARVLRAVAPDVVLIEEWDKGTAAELQSWFSTFVESGSGWHAVKPAEGGVAIVSRYPLAALDLPPLTTTDAEGKEHAVRFAGATTETPEGSMFVGALHLKCCGAMGTFEDTRREDEARLINQALDERRADLPDLRVIGGDFNLVGTRPPLDMLRAGLDADGSELAVADARVLGDAASYTWRDATTPFTPGRLDYVIFSDASARAVSAFVLNVSRLDAASLTGGLRPDDGDASDHMPVVVDLRPGPAPE